MSSIRKLLIFNQLLGVTLPKEYTATLGLQRGDYAEVFLSDKKTIIVRKLEVQPHKLTPGDSKISTTM